MHLEEGTTQVTSLCWVSYPTSFECTAVEFECRKQRYFMPKVCNFMT